MNRVLIIFSLAFFYSCASMFIKDANEKAVESIKKRAAFEANCDIEKVKISVLREIQGMYKELGASACGKKLVYIYVNGTWVLNTISK